MTDTKHLVKLLADVKLQNELKLLTQSSQICQFCQNKAEDEKLERVPKLKGLKKVSNLASGLLQMCTLFLK